MSWKDIRIYLLFQQLLYMYNKIASQWCACRGFLFCLFFSKLYSFKLERIQHNNISILSSTVLVLCFVFSYACFVFIWWGALVFMKRTGVWGSIPMYTSLLHIVYPFPWTLSNAMMCSGLELTLWFLLLALLHLGSRLQVFYWKSANKVPAGEPEQLLIPCSGWHFLGIGWQS